MATSTIKGGVASFNPTRNTSNTTSGAAKGMYDARSGLVRISINFNHSSDISTGTELFTVPTTYRPTANVQGNGFFQTAGGMTAGSITVNSSGQISQGASNACRSGFGYVEYIK